MIVDCHTHWGECYQTRDGLNPLQWLAGETRHGITHAVVAPLIVYTMILCSSRKTMIWPRYALHPQVA